MEPQITVEQIELFERIIDDVLRGSNSEFFTVHDLYNKLNDMKIKIKLEL